MITRSVLDFGTGSMLLAIAAFWSLLNGQTWEGQLMPVVKDFTVVESFRTPQGFDIAGYFDKARDCSYVDMAWYRKEGKINRRVSLSFKDQPKGVSKTRANGLQWFGLWSLGRPRDAVKPDIYYGVVRHRCHDLWLTSTQLGLVDLTKERPNEGPP